MRREINVVGNELSGTSVLVTRPVNQAEGFCNLIESVGGQVVRFPAIEIRPVVLGAEAERALQEPVDYLIFISANAARLGVGEIRRVARERLMKSRIVAIGKATAYELEKVGVPFDLAPPSPYNSESLLALPEMQDISGWLFTIIKGQGGRTYLVEQLRQRGGIVKEVDVYIRQKPRQSNVALKRLMACQRVVVSVTSVKGLSHLFEIASMEQREWLKQYACFLVPGERVASVVGDLHIRQRIIVAENATDQAMFQALLQFINEF